MPQGSLHEPWLWWGGKRREGRKEAGQLLFFGVWGRGGRAFFVLFGEGGEGGTG